MYDIQHLETQWYRYKRKKVLLPLAGISVLVLVAGGGYFYWSTLHSELVPAIQQADTVQHVQKEHVPEKMIKKSLLPEVPSAKKNVSKKQGWHMTFSDSETTKQDTQISSSVKHVDIHVSSKKTALTASEMEARFRFSKDKDDALFLARYYYDKKQYKKALNWALETNKLDSDIEESWLLFGRAKAKTGKRMEAIRVLQAYYNRTGSTKAKKLLDSIRRGTAF